MKKILFLFSFLFFLIVSAQPSYAVSITGSYSPSTVATGKDVTITIIIKDIPQQAVRINIGPSGSQDLAPGIEEMSLSGCDNKSPSASWKNLTCNGSFGNGNTLTIKGNYNTTSLASEVFFTSGRSYAAYVNGNQVPGSFVVGSAPSVPFSINSVSPSRAKENDIVSIKLANATVGHAYVVYTNRDVSSTTCNKPDCVLTFTVPFISNSNFSVKVLDRSTSPIQSLDVPITFSLSSLGNNAQLCCPEGFKDGFFDCPFFTDGSKCCRRLDFGSYDIVDKVPPNSVGVTGNFCCPLGYGTSGFDCPFGTDLTKQCCKRTGTIIGEYTKVDKISCTIPPACQFTATPPPAPCASNMVNGSCTKLSTGLGDISTTPSGIVRSLFGLILSISGGIALLLIIISGYKILSSQGNPEAIKGAREQLTAAIVGLLFIIFALVILQIIGVDILRIPGFSSRSSGGGFW